ncbi:MAG: peptidylprolyl isomerase [Halioglobus sp.]|jgi:FKBP-type peptidyl-prolyl cis-trans isomerase SlyD
MSLLIDDKRVVSMHYKLTDASGNVLDSSEGAEPLNYLHGAGNLIPGLEKALAGREQGDSLQVVVEPADAYGDVRPEMIQAVDRSAFQGVETVEPGMTFQAQGPDGATQRIVVTGVEGDSVTIDANHPLAGVQLHFDVQVVGVREATDEEIAHGHVH